MVMRELFRSDGEYNTSVNSVLRTCTLLSSKLIAVSHGLQTWVWWRIQDSGQLCASHLHSLSSKLIAVSHGLQTWVIVCEKPEVTVTRWLKNSSRRWWCTESSEVIANTRLGSTLCLAPAVCNKIMAVLWLRFWLTSARLALAVEFQLLSCSRIVDRFPVAALKNYHQTLVLENSCAWVVGSSAFSFSSKRIYELSLVWRIKFVNIPAGFL